MLFVVRGCQGHCVNGCWGWCVGVVVCRWGVGWKVVSMWHAQVPRQPFGSCVKRGEGEGVILLTSTLSVMRGVVVCRWWCNWLWCNMGSCFLCEKRRGEGGRLLTLTLSVVHR